MFHLFAHSKGKLRGKYDFAFVVKGKYIAGSNQGYEKKDSVFKAILSFAKHFGNLFVDVQDDTFKNSMVYNVMPQSKGRMLFKSESEIKPKKKYIPGK